MEQAFQTVATEAVSEMEVKGSRFISRCARTESVTEALLFIQSVKAMYLDATHNCWAYRITPNEYRFNDDGEPSGTAGQPILQAIIANELEQVTVVVTRYYGGTKLGAGGLVRAYGGGAGAVLRQAGRLLVRPRVSFSITVPFSEQSLVYRFLQTHPQLEQEALEYTQEGLYLQLSTYLDERDTIVKELVEALRGKVRVE